MRELDPGLGPEAAFRTLRRPGAPAVLYDGRGGHEGSWACRLAVEPRVVFEAKARAAIASGSWNPLDGLVGLRRRAGGPGGTGVAVLCSYEAFSPQARRSAMPFEVLALAVDASVSFPVDGPPRLAGRPDLVERAAAALQRGAADPVSPARTLRVAGQPRTSLGRDAYVRTVSKVKAHIVRGDVYQANLTQRFDAPFAADPWEFYRVVANATPAPRSAYVEVPGLTLVSVSPEVFVDVGRDGTAETRPIKGTRPRADAPAADAQAAADLLSSEKDRAELVMIVDVLRNDLGRLARTGSVAVPELFALRSYAAVHHLVARVVAALRDGVTPSSLLAAVFPGGSVTGAPKERAIEILRELEPCPRGLYTGSLFWFDDDGSTASSILIRSAIVTAGRVHIGAGGGVVADSEPEAEWLEANAKARALTRALGFDPEEAK